MSNLPNSRLNSRFASVRGFGLVELMVAIVVTLILGVAVAALFSYLTGQATRQRDDIEVIRASRAGLFALTRDLGNTGFLWNCARSPAVSTTAFECGNWLTGVQRASVTISPSLIRVSTRPIASGLNTTDISVDLGITPFESTTNTFDGNASVSYAVQTATANGQTTYTLQRTIFSYISGSSATDNVAQNVMATAFTFLLKDGTLSTTLPADLTTLRGIRVGMLTRSPFPDPKYTSPSTVTWLGGTYTIPSDALNYRYEAQEKEVTLINLSFSS